MDRTIRKIETLEQKIDSFIQNGNEKQEETLEMLEPDEEELEENGDDLEQWQVGKKTFLHHLAWERYHVPNLLARLVRGDQAFRLLSLRALLKKTKSP